MKRRIECNDLYNLIRGIAKQASILANDGKSVLTMDLEELTVMDLLDWIEPYKGDYIEVSKKKSSKGLFARIKSFFPTEMQYRTWLLKTNQVDGGIRPWLKK